MVLRTAALLFTLFSLLLKVSVASSLQSPVLIDAGTGGAFRTDITFDGKGNALAVFEQKTGNENRIYSNIFYKDKGWQSPLVIDAGSGDAYYARIASDKDGNAIALFKQKRGDFFGIYANIYSYKDGWQGAVAIDAGIGDTDGEQIAFDQKGNAVAVFEQKREGVYRIYASRHIKGKGWLAAVLIDTGPGRGYFPYPVFDRAGNIYVIYYKEEGGGLEVYISKYSLNDESWGLPIRLSDGRLIVREESWEDKYDDVSRGASGIYNPLFLDKLQDRVYSGFYSYESMFETPSNIDARFREAYRPSLVAGADGSIISFFVRWDGEYLRGYTAVYDLKVNRWSAPVLVDAGKGSVEHMRAVANREGEIALVFAQWIDGNIRIHSRIYEPESGWSDPEVIDMGKMDAFGPNLVFIDRDVVIVVWCQWTGKTVKTFKNIYKRGGWQGASPLDLIDGPVCGERIASGDDGRVIAIYEKMRDRVQGRSMIFAVELTVKKLSLRSPD